jgi:hypothetical protein
MPERQSRHPDNDLIDSMQEGGATPGQQSRAGGEVNRNVGTRAELERAEGEREGVTRATGSDNPEQDARKGDKTRDAIQRNRNQSS